MDKKIKNINHDIRSGKQLEENIPQLFNQLADYYNTYAGVRLAMHYYSFYEAYCDDENTWSKDAKDITTNLNLIIRDNILQSQSGLRREEAICTVDSIRKDIMKRLDMLTSYTDIFQIYEYVLNRLEYRFTEEFATVDEVEFSKEILRFIFDTEDNLIINERIKEIIGQLPIRITKQKYFELINESIHAYLGADQSSLDTYLYMLRTSAMLQQDEGMDIFYPGLWEKKDYLSHLEYKDITKENYSKALNILQAASITLEIETTVYFGLQEIANEVYAMLLCQSYAGMINNGNEAASLAAISVISEINDIFITQEKKELPEELMEKFTDMEGVQEEISYDITAMEDALYEIKVKHKSFTESLMLEQLLQVLLRTQSLLSNSLFINLEAKEVEEATVDEAMVQKEVKALEAELTQLFAGHDRMISRAVMASTINKMPVFFADHKEVMDYVRYSLERCSDIFEKAACTQIINTIMSE